MGDLIMNHEIEAFIPKFYLIREYSKEIFENKTPKTFKFDNLQKEIANNIKKQELYEINEWRLFSNSHLFSK